MGDWRADMVPESNKEGYKQGMHNGIGMLLFELMDIDMSPDTFREIKKKAFEILDREGAR